MREAEEEREEGPQCYHCKDWGHIRKNILTHKKIDGNANVTTPFESNEFFLQRQ